VGQAVSSAATTPETRRARPLVARTTGNNEWYTPAYVLDAVRLALGPIDLDPASTPLANEMVRATVFYTAEQDGLTQPWWGSVFLNPPYGRGLLRPFANAVCEKYDAQEITRACVLTNGATETVWFHRLLASADAMCLLKGRVKYRRPTGARSHQPTQGQVVFYLGEDVPRFKRSFENLGCVVELGGRR
jgi:phage N-6-adenine-methyltransferase